MSAQIVAQVSDIPASGVLAVEIEQQPVAIVRAEDGTIHAISDVCSHAEVALSEGEVSGCEIECWLHGARFDLRTGAPSGLPATQPIPVYPVILDGANILVDVSAPITPSVLSRENS